MRCAQFGLVFLVLVSILVACAQPADIPSPSASECNASQMVCESVVVTPPVQTESPDVPPSEPQTLDQLRFQARLVLRNTALNDGPTGVKAVVTVENPTAEAVTLDMTGCQLVLLAYDLSERPSDTRYARATYRADCLDMLGLEPVGMARSTYLQLLPDALEAEAATAHTPEGEPIPGRWHTYPEQAAAGLWTTPSDLARFALALQASLRGDEGALLSADTVRGMLTPQLGSFGLGLVVEEHGGETWFSHNGANEGYRCALLASAATGQGVVVMTSGDNGMALCNEITASAAHVYGWPTGQAKVRERISLDLTPYAGDYRFDDWPEPLTLKQDGDLLRAQFSGVWRGWWRLVPESEERFFMLDADLDLTFTLNDGGVEALALQDGVAQKL